MTKETVVLLVSASTDFVILTGTSLTAAMMAKGDAMLPTWPVILLSVIGGTVAFARTVQQNLRKPDDVTKVTVTKITETPAKEATP